MTNLPAGLTQSIQDIRFDTLTRGFQYRVQLSDWQHMEGTNDSVTVILTSATTPLSRNIAGTDIPLKSNNPDFTGSASCVSRDCTTGTLNIVYAGSAHGSLSGSAKVSFYQTQLLTFTKLLALAPQNRSPEESAVAGLVGSNKLRGGLIEQYRILGGRTNPFQLTLYYGSGLNLTWHGFDQGANAAFTIEEKQNGKTLLSYPTTAGLTYISPNSLEFCFGQTQTLQAIGVFGAGDKPLSPTQLCTQ